MKVIAQYISALEDSSKSLQSLKQDNKAGLDELTQFQPFGLNRLSELKQGYWRM